MKNECPNCGNIFAETESACKFCGTRNERYVKKQPASEVSEVKVVLNNVAQQKTWSLGVFLLLLFVCWPIAILYLLINVKK